MKLENEIYQNKFKNEYQKAFVNIIYTHNWLNQFQCSLLKKFKITTQQFNVLRILRGQYPNPSSITLVRTRMLDKMSDASRIIDKLVTKKLVSRKYSRDDKRKADVIITQKGLDLLSKIDELEPMWEEKLSQLNSTEIKKLNLLLDKLRG